MPRIDSQESEEMLKNRRESQRIASLEEKKNESSKRIVGKLLLIVGTFSVSDAGRLCHDRFRDGHRQTGRPLRHTLLHPEIHRRILPGIRQGRKRRRNIALHPLLFLQGRPSNPPHD